MLSTAFALPAHTARPSADLGIYTLRRCRIGQTVRHFRATSSSRPTHRRCTASTLTEPSTPSLLTSDSSLRKPSSGNEKDHQNGNTFRGAYGQQLPSWLLSRLEDLQFIHPTPVQASTLPLALPPSEDEPGRDIVIHAQTGSGKTLAYLLPALSTIDPRRACTQALIVVPTQELGMQVYKLLRRILSSYPHTSTSNSTEDTGDEEDLLGDSHNHWTFPVLPMLDQADLRRQKLQLRQAAPRVIVGNPRRVAQLVESGRLRLHLLKVLVVDEFDACLLNTSTTQALQAILAVRNRERPRQTILASATVPQHRHFLRQCVRQRWTRPDIEHVWVEGKSGECVPSSLEHMYVLCERRKKLAALRTLLLRFNDAEDKAERLNIRAMVFVMPSRSIYEIVKALNKSLDNYFGTADAKMVVGIRNDLPIVQRREAMRRFRSGEASVLIGTDVAARGLDVPDVSHVFHFDLATDPDAYLHRAGRAGRQGRPGSSLVLITPGEQFVINRTANALNIEFTRIGR